MDKHDLLRSSFQKLKVDTASTDGGRSVPSVATHGNDRESKSAHGNKKYIEKLYQSTIFVTKISKLHPLQPMNRKDQEQRQHDARKDREHQEKLELKRRLEDLFTEKRKVQRMEAEHTFGDVRNEGLAAYFRKEVEQIECHEKQLNQQL